MRLLILIFAETYQRLIEDGQLTVSLTFPANSDLHLTSAVPVEPGISETSYASITNEPLFSPGCECSGVIYKSLAWEKEREEVCLFVPFLLSYFLSFRLFI